MKNDKVFEQNDIVKKISHEVTYRRYLMSKGKYRNFFSKITILEYLLLHYIAYSEKNKEIYNGKTYLNDISSDLDITLRRVSKIVASLKEKGYVSWSHDGDGKQGTYITITETGIQILNKQEEILKNLFTTVIDKYGKEKLIQFLKMANELETVIKAECELYEEEDEYDE